MIAVSVHGRVVAELNREQDLSSITQRHTLC